MTLPQNPSPLSNFPVKSLFIATFFFSCLFGASEGSAQERTCRVIFADRNRDAPEEVHLFDGVSSRKVTLSDMNFSEVMTLPSGDLALSLTQHLVSNPGEIPPGSPTLKVSAGTTDVYIIVLSDPENKTLPLRMLPADSGDQVPKTGETLWVNLSPHTIKGKLGNGNFTLPAGGRMVAKAPLPESGYYKAEFQYQPDGAGEFLPVMKKSWWFDATSRNLGFIIDTGERLPKIFAFRDRRDPSE